MLKSILVVDDDFGERQLLQSFLHQHGFRVEVAVDGQDALDMVHHELPDLIIMDIMMPKMDGFEFLRRYRQEKRTPVIIITSRDEEADAVLGLELGADDYIVKPLRLNELVARIQAIFRRVDGTHSLIGKLRIGDITLDLSKHQVVVHNQQKALTPIEYNLLAIFMRSPGLVFTRAQLVGYLTDNGSAGTEQTLNVHIRNLRKKIQCEANIPEYIETVSGVGYRFKKMV